MLLVKFPDVLWLLLLGLQILGCFILPDFSLYFIPTILFFQAKSFVTDLLKQVVLGGNFLLMKTMFSPFLIFHLRLFPGKVLCKNSFIFFFLLLFVILNNCLSHHIHELPLPLFSISHLICPLLLLLLNKSCILLLSLNIFQPLLFLFLSLDRLIPFVVLQHFPQSISLLLLPI